MKKIVLGLTTLLLSLSAQELTPEQWMQIQSYNHKSSLKLKQQHLLNQLAQVSEADAHTLAQNECGGDISRSKLMQHNRRLFYTIALDRCTLQIDALDGSIMRKEVN